MSCDKVAVNCLGELANLQSVDSEAHLNRNSPQQRKRCTKCDEVKQFVEFRNHRSTKDGLQYWCKACQTQFQRQYLKSQQGRENQRQAQKAYRGTSAGREIEKSARIRFNKTPRGKIIRLKARSKLRGLAVTISADEFERWWEETPHACSYCGCTADEYREMARRLSVYNGEKRLRLLLKSKLLKLAAAARFGLTVDRADNDQGYAAGNLMKACWFCNSVKGHFLTSAEMKMVGLRIRREIDSELSSTTFGFSSLGQPDLSQDPRSP